MREEGRQELPASLPPIRHGTVDTHSRHCILVELETSCPLSSTAIIRLMSKCFPVRSHLLLTKKYVVFCFFLFRGSNQPKILSYSLPDEPAVFPIGWRQPYLVVAFWGSRCTQCSTALGGELQIEKQGWGEALVKSACSTILKSSLKPPC